MSRVSGWERVLADQIARAARTPFAWGEFDCALFVCDVAAALTGKPDPAAWFRGKYSDGRGAFRAVKKFVREEGCGTSGSVAVFEVMIDKITAANDWPEIPVAHAQRGDIVLIREPKPGIGWAEDIKGLGALGVVTGPLAMFTSPAGVLPARTRLADRAWHIA